MRSGLATMIGLQGDMEIVGEAENGRAAVELAVGKPDRITERTNAEGQTLIWRYVDGYGYYDSGFLYTGYYGRWGGGGWGRHGGYYGGGYWGSGFYGGRPSQRSDRLRIEFKNSAVSSIVQEKKR